LLIYVHSKRKQKVISNYQIYIVAILAKVIVKNKMLRFLWFSVYMLYVYAWAFPAHPYSMSSITWVCCFIEPDLFDHNVSFDNTTPIYLISLLWKLGLGLGLLLLLLLSTKLIKVP